MHYDLLDSGNGAVVLVDVTVNADSLMAGFAYFEGELSGTVIVSPPSKEAAYCIKPPTLPRPGYKLNEEIPFYV